MAIEISGFAFGLAIGGAFSVGAIVGAIITNRREAAERSQLKRDVCDMTTKYIEQSHAAGMLLAELEHVYFIASGQTRDECIKTVMKMREAKRDVK